MPYVVDAHPLIWHFTNDKKLGINARAALEQIDIGRAGGLVPTIVLAEILYASERGRISVTLQDVLRELRRRRNYRIVSIGEAILRQVPTIKDVPELHDRMIVATAVRQKAVVITRDEDIANPGAVKTVW